MSRKRNLKVRALTQRAGKPEETVSSLFPKHGKRTSRKISAVLEKLPK